MIPLRDNVPRSTWPWITVAIIAVNCAVFLHEVSLEPHQLNSLIYTYALVPSRTTAFLAGHRVAPAAALLPFFTSMFLHGGWMHLIGNMWFLWIFGDNVEDRVGHIRYLWLYLICGLAGAGTSYYFGMNSTVPMLGASGAIAGVMGAYLITFPRARILTLVFIVVFITTLEIPAYFILLYWILLQFVSGVMSLGIQSQGGVAWFAHVGGFAIGIPLMLLLRPARKGRVIYAR